MTDTHRDPAGVPDPYLTKQGLTSAGGGPGSWAPTGERTEPDAGGGWENWAIFAGIILLLAGVGRVLLGLLALFDASHFDAAESDPALPIGYTAWGWIQLLGGAFLLAAGGALMARKQWARFVAIVLVALNAVGSLAFLPTAPVWGTILIALDVVIVYALTVHYPRRGT